MKISIVTLYGEYNYGNRLQNYALQHTIETLGYDVNSIAVIRDCNPVKRYIKKYVEKKNSKIKLIDHSEREREKNFSNFTSNFINTIYYYEKNGRIPDKAGDIADCYIVGSDQVWNPLFWEDSDSSPEMYNYLLGFTNNRKVAYAASFGISSISEKWKKRFEPLIKKFESISVRENEGEKIVLGMGLEASVVLDPTLLLDAVDWRTVERNRIPKDKKYALLYFLGEKPGSLRIEENIEIIDLMDIREKFYTCGPEMFVELIDKATIVYTDSFHAAVFSMIFHTPFVVFDRKHANKSNMSGRITTLLDSINIKGGLSENKINIIQTGEKEDILLAEKRRLSLDYLKSAVKLQ